MFVYDHTPTVTLTDRRRSDPVDDNYISAAKHDQQRRNSAAMAALPKTVAVVPLQTSPLSQSARGSQKMDPFKSSDEPEDPSLLDPESDASPGQSSEPLLYGSSSVDPDQMLSTIDHDLERAVEALSDLWQDESNTWLRYTRGERFRGMVERCGDAPLSGEGQRELVCSNKENARVEREPLLDVARSMIVAAVKRRKAKKSSMATNAATPRSRAMNITDDGFVCQNTIADNLMFQSQHSDSIQLRRRK